MNFTRRIRIRIYVALIGVAACTSATYAQGIQDPIRVASDRNEKIREHKQKATKLDKPLSKSQPIYVKMLDSEEVEFQGKHWTTQHQKDQMTNLISELISRKTLDFLLYEGFAGYAYEESKSEISRQTDDAIVVEIRIQKLRYGEEHHLAAISVRIYDFNDPTFVYGTYLDEGRVNRLSRRIAQRFALSSDGKK